MRGWIPFKGLLPWKNKAISCRPPRNRRPWISSGPEGSSDKWCGLCRGLTPVNLMAYVFRQNSIKGAQPFSPVICCRFIPVFWSLVLRNCPWPLWWSHIFALQLRCKVCNRPHCTPRFIAGQFIVRQYVRCEKRFVKQSVTFNKCYFQFLDIDSWGLIFLTINLHDLLWYSHW